MNPYINKCIKENTHVDALFVNPSTNIATARKYIEMRRIEKNVGNQETPPLGIAYILSSLKKKGMSGAYVDMALDERTPDDLLSLIAKLRPALVGFSAFTVQIRAAAQIASMVKKRFENVAVCVGGPHATAIPAETIQEFPFFDMVISGEGEEIIPTVIHSLYDGKPFSGIQGVVTADKPFSQPAFIDDVDRLPLPDWDPFYLPYYAGGYPHGTKRELPMVTGRGCPYHCVFCAGTSGKIVRQRSVESVIEEIERNIMQHNCEAICFVDETLTMNMKWANEFFEAMLRKNLNKAIKWACSTRVDRVSDSLFKLMKRSGCYYIFFGIESGDDNLLIQMKKKITVEKIREAVALAKKHGLIPVGSFILGLPGETESSIRKSLDLAKELNLYSVTFPIACPFPGTELREMALKGDCGLRILSDDWNDYGKQFPGVMDTADLPIERLRALQRLAYEQNPKKALDDYCAKVLASG